MKLICINKANLLIINLPPITYSVLTDFLKEGECVTQGRL